MTKLIGFGAIYITREGGVKDASTFCCLGDSLNLEEIQGAKEDDDVSMRPLEFNFSGVDT